MLGGSALSELTDLKQLLDQQLRSEDEYATKRAAILARSEKPPAHASEVAALIDGSSVIEAPVTGMRTCASDLRHQILTAKILVREFSGPALASSIGHLSAICQQLIFEACPKTTELVPSAGLDSVEQPEHRDGALRILSRRDVYADHC